MALIQEFKDFISKGNVLDMAVGVIIGGAFGKIVSSLIDDVITPVLLNPALKEAHVDNIAELHFGGIKYGVFLSNTISFLVVAFVLFLLIKGFNSMKKKAAEAPATPAAPSEDIVLLREIRDALKK